MKLLHNFQLALVILLLTDIATFDYARCKSRKLTEGTCPKKKCMLEKCAAGGDEPSTCEKQDCPIRLASCNVKQKECNACSKERSCSFQLVACPCCGEDTCPQQQKKTQKLSACQIEQPSCPQRKANCPSMQHKSQCKTSCPGVKRNCAQPKSKCPQGTTKAQTKPHQKSCPSEKECPQRCSFFFKLPFSTIINTKDADDSKVDYKGKYGYYSRDGDGRKDGEKIKFI